MKNKMLVIFTTLFLCLLSVPVLAATYYVDAVHGSDSLYDGTTSEVSGGHGPWKSITKATFVTNSTIMVAPGVYDNTVSEVLPISMGSSNAFFSTITGAATIDGTAYGGPCIITLGNASVNDFTIKWTSGGPCIDVSPTATSAAITGNIIINSNSSGKGINIEAGANDSSITSNAILANYGITDLAANTSIISNRILCYNYNVGNSYGLYFNGAGPCTVKFNEIRNYFAGTSSSGVCIGGSGGTINLDKNTIVKNYNGIYNVAPSGFTANIKNSIIASEVGGYSGSGTTGINHSGGTVGSQYNCFFGNDTNYAGTVSSTNDVVNTNPQFIDATNNDFNLEYFSPCIDTGDPAVLENDVDGTRTDIGAFPYIQSDFTGPIISVLTPLTGESIVTGSNYNITWTATDPSGIRVNSINLYYSSNGGTIYNLISAGNPNSGTYSWTAPSQLSSTAKIRITARDSAPLNQLGNLGTGESGMFNIASPGTTSTSTTSTSNTSIVTGSTLLGTSTSTSSSSTSTVLSGIRITSKPTAVLTGALLNLGFVSDQARQVSLVIYDVGTGMKQKTIPVMAKRGLNNIVWDWKKDQAEPGIYYWELVAGDSRAAWGNVVIGKVHNQ